MKLKDLIKIVPVLYGLMAIVGSAYSQTRFDQGFKEGFHKGYCYGSPGGIACISPISPIPPLPTVNESLDNYQDGYNEGFLTGIDVQRMYAKYDKNSPYYGRSDGYYKQVIPHQFPDYQAPFSLSLFGSVLMYKEKMYEAGGAYIQKKIHSLYLATKQLALNTHNPYRINYFEKEFRNVILNYVNDQNFDFSLPDVVKNVAYHIDEQGAIMFREYGQD